MNETNWVVAVAGIVVTVLIGCVTYFNVIDSNNSKDIVTRAIERGIDPTAAACAAQVSTTSKDVRSTCEKYAITKGK